MTRIPRRAAPLGLALCALVAVSGCGTNTSSTGGGSGNNGISGKTASAAFTTMLGSLKSVSSVEITGGATYMGYTVSGDIKVTLANQTANGLDASVTVNGGTAQLWDVSKTYYVEGDSKLFTLIEGLAGTEGTTLTPADKTAINSIAGKCINLGGPGQAGSPGALVTSDVPATSTKINSIAAPVGLTKGSVTTVDGQSVLPLIYTSGTDKYTLDVSTTGNPYPVAASVTTDNVPITIQFKNWNSVGSLTAPGPCEGYQALETQFGPLLSGSGE